MERFFRYNKTTCHGFTLVEILVVLGLFSSVMTIAAGALFTTQAVNVKLQETQSILDNVNLSMETMTREIRYGTDFHCDISLLATSSSLRKNCTFTNNGGTVLFFKPNTMVNDKDRVAYYLKNTGVLYKDEYLCGDDNCTIVSTSTYQITGDDVVIKSLVFYVTGANTVAKDNKDISILGVVQHDYTQPLITLSVAGETKSKKSGATTATSTGIVKFTVQTSISSRQLDN